MKLNQSAKTMAIARFAGTPRMPGTLKKGAFEAIGGQVGHEHVIAAHLDGEGTGLAHHEPRRVPKEDRL